MYVTGLLLYAAIISALVGYLGGGPTVSLQAPKYGLVERSAKPNCFVKVLLKAYEMCTCFLRNLTLTEKQRGWPGWPGWPSKTMVKIGQCIGPSPTKECKRVLAQL